MIGSQNAFLAAVRPVFLCDFLLKADLGVPPGLPAAARACDGAQVKAAL
jgi:hypothetical protein